MISDAINGQNLQNKRLSLATVYADSISIDPLFYVTSRFQRLCLLSAVVLEKSKPEVLNEAWVHIFLPPGSEICTITCT
jgi:hypothetical protein